MEFITDNWLAVIGFVAGLLCVWLLIKESIFTFPLGLLYAMVTVVVMVQNKLYADVLLNFYYVLMNAYGWYFWLRGGGMRRAQQTLEVGWLPGRQRLPATVVVALGTGSMGWYFATYTDASLAYADSFTTVLSFVAMWMSARKYMESWGLWFVVNVASVVLYLYKASGDAGLYLYAALYAVYIGMAIAGWRAWKAHLPERVMVTA